MSKIICEICGTVYQDTADCCPICGYAHGNDVGENLLADSPLAERGKSVRVSEALPKKQKEIFDFDEVNPDENDNQKEVYFEEDLEADEEHHQNYLLIILLVTIITLLLTACAFLFFRFYLPNAVLPPETEPVQTQETELPTQTTQPEIPCQSLTLTSGVTQLNRAGQLWLLHVTVLPEDTTDPLVFYSEDESVVTVSETGRLTAIGEGETYVYIACGDKELRCHVVVLFEEETVPTEETIPSDLSITPEETTQATDAAETEYTEEVVLKLKDSDRSSNKRGVSFDLELDCDLKPEDVTWLTLDSRVAIVRNGTVTTIGPGQTKIIAQYKGQQVECIIRCNF